MLHKAKDGHHSTVKPKKMMNWLDLIKRGSFLVLNDHVFF